MRYERLGRGPRASATCRCAATAASSPLLTEEVMGYEGFSGNETILYHLHSPCRLDSVGEFRPIEREEWVPDAHVHRLADTGPIEPGGDPLSGRRLLMFNGDIEVSVCKPVEALDGFYRNGEGDEVIYVHRGGGVLRTVFGRVPFRREGLRRDPARDHAHLRARRGRAGLALLPHARARSRRPTATATATASCSSTRRSRSATSTRRPSSRRVDESGEFPVTVRVRDGYQDYVLDRHPFDVVGWDGYVWPYTFNADDFEPRAGRFHLPPPAHQTFQGPELRDLHVRAADARLGPARPCRCPTTTRTSSPRRSCSTPRATTRRARASTSAASRCTPRACRTARSPGAVEKALGVEAHRRAGGDVGHLPAAAADHALARPRQARVRAVVEPGPGARRSLMFEEAQLYSPVTEGEDGVVVHLADDHPGASDPDYRARRGRDRRGGARAGSPGEPAPDDRVHRGGAERLAHGLPRARAQARALRLPGLPRGGGRAGPAARPHPSARGGQRAARAAHRLPLRARRRASSRSPSSTARWPTASSTRPSTSATPPRRSTRPSPT